MPDPQTTDTIVLIEPVHFGINPDADDNGFAHFGEKIPNTQQKALKEFCNFAKALQKNKIQIIVFKDTHTPRTPDSIFPNNVISTHPDGEAVLYSMKPVNRRDEVSKHREFLDRLGKQGYTVSRITDYSGETKNNLFLEGTGSMVLDRTNKIAYGCISERTSTELFEKWGKEHGYEIIVFRAVQQKYNSEKLLPVYHANLVMSIGENFAAICFDVIPHHDERKKVKTSMREMGKQIIKLTAKQFYQRAGNMLEVRNTEGKRFTVMSQAAFNSLGNDQASALRKLSGEIIATDISTIEEVGGGSARCMMLEVFLAKAF